MYSLYYRPFPSSLGPLFQNEAKYKTIQMKMSLLLGLSKGNARVEISASFFFFFFRSATVCNSVINTHARRFY